MKILLTCLLFSFLMSCIIDNSGNRLIAFSFDKSEIKIAEKVQFRFFPGNPFKHEYHYKYSADRGQVIANNGTASTALYYAPFTGGPDTIRVQIYDKTDSINLPITTHQVFVQGESMAYVELPNSGVKLNDEENGITKVTLPFISVTTKEIGRGRTPTISPDGSYVAYVYYPGDGSSQIILKDPMGNETNLTNHKSLNHDPSWAPVSLDGKKYLIFSSDRDFTEQKNKRFHLWKVNITTKELTQITSDECSDIQPDWSPNGKLIVFSSNCDNNTETNYYNIYNLNTENNKKTKLSQEQSEGNGLFNPKWSPDSKKIVYSRKYKFRQIQKIADMQKIWLINLDLNSEGFGNIVTRAFDESIIETYPSWTPDGRKISFIRSRGTENSIASVDLSPNIFFTTPFLGQEIINVTEASWARQKSYGSGYAGFNPFNTPSPSINPDNKK